MKFLYRAELASANIVSVLRSKSVLIALFAFFAIYITARTGFALEPLIMKTNKEAFDFLVKNKIIAAEKTVFIALFLGFLISLVTETSGFVLAMHGKEIQGVILTGFSSFVSAVQMISVASGYSEIIQVIFTNGMPIYLIFEIAHMISKSAGEQDFDAISEFTKSASSVLKAGFSKNAQNAQKAINELLNA